MSKARSRLRDDRPDAKAVWVSRDGARHRVGCSFWTGPCKLGLQVAEASEGWLTLSEGIERAGSARKGKASRCRRVQRERTERGAAHSGGLKSLCVTDPVGRQRKVDLMPEIDAAAIREAVRKKYVEVAHSAEGKFAYPTGRRGAFTLGYDPSILASLPDDVLASFCGVGNPFALGPIQQGEAVLDVGCGAGVDMIVASRIVGSAGKVCGIDMTPAMAERARANIRRASVADAEVQISGAESIPYPDACFDVVISNGVINLSPVKEEVFREIHRVLRPGGRLQFADIVVNQALPPEVANSLEAWSQ